jgi:hypothetical protein
MNWNVWDMIRNNKTSDDMIVQVYVSERANEFAALEKASKKVKFRKYCDSIVFAGKAGDLLRHSEIKEAVKNIAVDDILIFDNYMDIYVDITDRCANDIRDKIRGLCLLTEDLYEKGEML